MRHRESKEAMGRDFAGKLQSRLVQGGAGGGDIIDDNHKGAVGKAFSVTRQGADDVFDTFLPSKQSLFFVMAGRVEGM